MAEFKVKKGVQGNTSYYFVLDEETNTKLVLKEEGAADHARAVASFLREHVAAVGEIVVR